MTRHPPPGGGHVALRPRLQGGGASRSPPASFLALGAVPAPAGDPPPCPEEIADPTELPVASPQDPPRVIQRTTRQTESESPERFKILPLDAPFSQRFGPLGIPRRTVPNISLDQPLLLISTGSCAFSPSAQISPASLPPSSGGPLLVVTGAPGTGSSQQLTKLIGLFCGIPPDLFCLYFILFLAVDTPTSKKTK